MASPTCILCPGQGAQIVGMGKDFSDCSAAAREVFQTAGDVLGFDLASICFSGPQEKLDQTDISQPAIYTAGVASFRAGCEAGFVDPATVNCYAGLSLGEYTALHLAGVFSFEEGLKLVAARGRYMQEAALASPGGMVALIGGDEAAVTALCQEAAEGEVLAPANYNAPGQIVASGSMAACQRLAKLAEGKGLKAMPLRVAGAFHSPLMAAAAQRMKNELDRVTFRQPQAVVYANVTARPHEGADSIKSLLVDQIVKPVKWDQTMAALLAAGECRYVELAPGRTLAGLFKRVNRRLSVESLAAASVLNGKAKS